MPGRDAAVHRGAVEVALAHRTPAAAAAAAVPADVAALVAELTAQDPLARPRDAGEVARRAAGFATP